jgi:hypothetical protein
VAEFAYSGLNPRNMLQAIEAISGAASASKSHTLTLARRATPRACFEVAEPATAASPRRPSSFRRAFGAPRRRHLLRRRRALGSSDRAATRCTPRSSTTDTARERSPFRWRYHAFGRGYTTLVKRVGAGRVFRIGYKHVIGSTVTTIRAHGDTLVRERTAPGGNYRPCR